MYCINQKVDLVIDPKYIYIYIYINIYIESYTIEFQLNNQ